MRWWRWHDKKRIEMGENGYRRVMGRYRIEDMKRVYGEIYQSFDRKGES